jgi:hypothetical protein
MQIDGTKSMDLVFSAISAAIDSAVYMLPEDHINVFK